MNNPMSTNPTEQNEIELGNEIIHIFKKPTISSVSTSDVAIGMMSSTVLIEKVNQLTALIQRKVREAEPELLDALYWMYMQYCSKNGHDFMGAGETASELLENYGYIETDNTGKVLKDNGDSIGIDRLVDRLATLKKEDSK